MTRASRFLWLGLLLPGSLLAQQRIERRWAVDPEISFRITSTMGSIQVRGWDRDSIVVVAELAPGAGGFFGGASGRAGKIGIERSEHSKAPGPTLELLVPRRARLWIKTVSAVVEVSDVDGELDLYSVNGALGVRGAPRVLTAEALDGPITAELGTGVARLRTGAGPIQVTSAGGDVTAVSVEGRVELDARSLTRGRLESVSGAVRFGGNLAPGGGLETESHAGDITLRFAGPVNADFDLTSVAGPVRNELTGATSPARGKSVRFTVGTGAAEVTARTFKGIITVGTQGGS